MKVEIRFSENPAEVGKTKELPDRQARNLINQGRAVAVTDKKPSNTNTNTSTGDTKGSK